MPSLVTSDTVARDEIAAQAATFDGFLDAAERCSADGRLETAAVLVQCAAGIAALRHPGRFADARAEEVLRAAARGLPRPAHRGGGGVLHVLSNALEVGGHTRLAWRWMERDGRDRPQSFVVLRPGCPTPAALAEAARRTGGVEHVVPGVEAGLLATAAALRELAADFDLLVLHVQPNDALPSLAFGDGAPRAPTLLCDHADHCFWLGRDAADVVVGHRSAAARMATERRGVPAARTATLALPLDETTPTAPPERAAARTRIGIPEGARVLLTIGSAYKFSCGDRHLLDALEPLLHAHPTTVLIAVGPAPTGRWAAAAAAAQGRVIAAGVLPDVRDVLAAADVYVESYPCSSGTAAVEAAQSGLPVVAWAPDEQEAALLGSAGAAAELWPVARTVDDLHAAIARAAPSAAALAAHHDPDRWRADLAAAERGARTLGPVRAGELAWPDDALSGTDVVLHHLHARTGHRHADDVVAVWSAQAAALARWPLVERCFVPSLAGATTHLELVRCFDSAVAHPGPGEEHAAVDALRVLVRSRIAARGVVAVHPDRVDEALPALEAALAVGDEVDLDVTPTTQPDALLLHGVLAVRTPGDGFGEAAVAVEA